MINQRGTSFSWLFLAFHLAQTIEIVVYIGFLPPFFDWRNVFPTPTLSLTYLRRNARHRWLRWKLRLRHAADGEALPKRAKDVSDRAMADTAFGGVCAPRRGHRPTYMDVETEGQAVTGR